MPTDWQSKQSFCRSWHVTKNPNRGQSHSAMRYSDGPAHAGPRIRQVIGDWPAVFWAIRLDRLGSSSQDRQDSRSYRRVIPGWKIKIDRTKQEFHIAGRHLVEPRFP
jgi:hypothetical protein